MNNIPNDIQRIVYKYINRDAQIALKEIFPITYGRTIGEYSRPKDVRSFAEYYIETTFDNVPYIRSTRCKRCNKSSLGCGYLLVRMNEWWSFINGKLIIRKTDWSIEKVREINDASIYRFLLEWFSGK